MSERTNSVVAERGELTEIETKVKWFRDKIRQYSHIVALGQFSTPREGYQAGLSDAFETLRPLLEACMKTADHRLIGHTEPDPYTKLGCVTNIAHEAVDEASVGLMKLYNGYLNVARQTEQESRKPDEKEPWGASNPAWSKSEADHRIREWAETGMCLEVNIWEVLGWTETEYRHFLKDRLVPPCYAKSK